MRALIILAALMLLVSGCTELQSMIPTSFPGLQSQPQSGAVLGPSGTVSMEMIYPREKGQVIRDITFSPLINVRNTGSSDARGQVCITGLDSSVFGGAGSCDCRTYAYSKTEDESFQVENLAFGPYSISQDPQATDFTITAINRYAYTSKALFKPCIRKEYDTSDCSLQLSEASNGPIAIMSITEIATPSQGKNMVMAFNVELKKVSTGRLIQQRAVETECLVEELSFDSRKVQPKINGVINGLPFMGSVECKEATLKEDGTGTMSCVVGEIDLFDENGNYRFSGNYQTPSSLAISYGFEEVDSNRFTIGASLYQ